jgi:hypothetical protein
MALVDEATPDWETLLVEDPTDPAGLHGRVWFERVATVTATSSDRRRAGRR